MTLDDIALKYNTDKSSSYHNYTEKYERHFARMRNERLKILEIGIQNGFSLKTWKEYFSRAEIFGIDIVDCKHIDEDRIITLKGSQNDLLFLKSITEQYGPFDIIIDDGSHYNNDMKISLEALFPLMKNGGVYVVEDTHCCYWPEFSDGNSGFMDRLKKLMDSINGNGKCGLAEIDNIARDRVYQEKMFGTMDWWEKNVEAIHQYRSIVFIEKQTNGTSDIPKMRKNQQMIAQLWRFSGKVLRRIINESKTSFNRVLSLQNLFYPTPAREIIKEYRKSIKIYDCFIFFNELDLLEIRLNLLNDSVDYFVIVEATKTFTGKPKPLYYEANKDRFALFSSKILHVVVDDLPNSFKELQDRYPSANPLEKEIIDACLTTGNIPKDQSQWLREFYQKEQIKKGVVGANDNDICYISDIDEIWNPEIVIDYRRPAVFKLEELMYAYYLNNRSSEKWCGTIVMQYNILKNNSVNHLDTPSITQYVYIKNGGWHFTNQGGAENIKTKIESYGHQEFNNDVIKSQIEQHMRDNKDFVGRNFTFWTEEKDLPDYIVRNKNTYKELFK